MTSGMPGETDTIAAIATPSGRGAIAVVRVSGLRAFDIVRRLVAPWPLTPRRATLCRITDPSDGSLIDRGVACVYQGPNTYTGEDTVELSCHGGTAVATALLKTLLVAGAREALPGEFTRRAVLNGKLDLVQAEAIGDLIDAPSESLRRVAIHQVDGGLSRVIERLRSQLLDLEALLAYDIDFPEEDDGPVSRERITNAAELIVSSLAQLLETGDVMAFARDGAIVVIAGRPNVGKSALFNAILGEGRAIVADVPGTTRDAIEARIEILDWPVRLIDTAGLRSASDIVERLGIEVSERYLSRAHLIVACSDHPEQLGETVRTIRGLSETSIIPVLTKVDLDSDGAALHPYSFETDGESLPVIRVSALRHSGLRDLLDRIRQELNERIGTIPVDRPAVTRTRQRLAVGQAFAEMQAFLDVWRAGAVPATIAAVHIRSAIGELDELIGAVTVEDVLGRLFSTFCVGK